MIGRSFRSAIVSTTSRVNALPFVLTPMMTVGLMDLITSTKSREGAWGWA